MGPPSYILYCSRVVGLEIWSKIKIKRKITNIKQDVLKSTFLNFRKRLNLIIEAIGGHIEQKQKFL